MKVNTDLRLRAPACPPSPASSALPQTERRGVKAPGVAPAPALFKPDVAVWMLEVLWSGSVVISPGRSFINLDLVASVVTPPPAWK